MSNDKSEATYHGHLDPTHPTTDSIAISPGYAVVDGEVQAFESQVVETPKEPGKYELHMAQGQEPRWVKVAEVTVPKHVPTGELIGRFLGATICITVVLGGLAIGIRALISWLWGV